MILRVLNYERQSLPRQYKWQGNICQIWSKPDVALKSGSFHSGRAGQKICAAEYLQIGQQGIIHNKPVSLMRDKRGGLRPGDSPIRWVRHPNFWGGATRSPKFLDLLSSSSVSLQGSPETILTIVNIARQSNKFVLIASYRKDPIENLQLKMCPSVDLKYNIHFRSLVPEHCFGIFKDMFKAMNIIKFSIPFCKIYFPVVMLNHWHSAV